MAPRLKREILKVSEEKDTNNEARLKYGKGLERSVSVDITLRAVNNGYTLTVDHNHYVFSNHEDMLEFIGDAIPLKGTDKNFIDSLSLDDEDDEDSLPF